MKDDPKNIILDFGGVLMRHNREGFLQAMQALVCNVADLSEAVGLGNDRPDTLRARFEIGEIGEEEFVKHVLALCMPGTTVQQVIEAWNMIHAGIDDSTWAEVRRLKENGHNMYLLSNTDAIHWAHTMALYGEQIDELFDELFLSFRVGLAKPDETIYRLVNDAIHATPDSTLFVDDTAVNRRVAEECVGWKTYAEINELDLG